MPVCFFFQFLISGYYGFCVRCLLMGWEGHDECLPAVCGVCCVWGVLLSAGWCAEFGIHTLFCSDINVCLEKRGAGRLRCGCMRWRAQTSQTEDRKSAPSGTLTARQSRAPASSLKALANRSDFLPLYCFYFKVGVGFYDFSIITPC